MSSTLHLQQCRTRYQAWGDKAARRATGAVVGFDKDFWGEEADFWLRLSEDFQSVPVAPGGSLPMETAPVPTCPRRNQ